MPNDIRIEIRATGNDGENRKEGIRLADMVAAGVNQKLPRAIGKSSGAIIGEIRKVTRVAQAEFAKIGKSLNTALSIKSPDLRNLERQLERLGKVQRAAIHRFSPMMRSMSAGIGGMAERDFHRFQREQALHEARRVFANTRPDGSIRAARSRRAASPSLDPSLGAFGRFAVSTASSIFILDHIARIFLHRVINPMIDAAKNFIRVNEDAARFRIGASTALGGLGNATMLDRELAYRNRAMPIGRAEMREAGQMVKALGMDDSLCNGIADVQKSFAGR